MALYNAVTSKENPHLWPCSTIYSGYSAHAVMTQYGNVDITLDIIRGIDTIRRGAHALLQGIHKSGCIHVLMLKIEMDILRLSHIHDTLPQVPPQSHARMLYLSTKIYYKYT